MNRWTSFTSIPINQVLTAFGTILYCAMLLMPGESFRAVPSSRLPSSDHFRCSTNVRNGLDDVKRPIRSNRDTKTTSSLFVFVESASDGGSYDLNLTATPATTTSATYSPILDQEGRAWRSNTELRETTNYTRVRMPSNSSSREGANFHTNLGKHDIMLKNPRARFVLDEERWMHRYDALTKFYQKNGHTNVPIRCEGENEVEETRGRLEPYLQLNLGQWVIDQRREYRYRAEYEEQTRLRAEISIDEDEEDDDDVKNWAPPRMTDERIALLEQLSFKWDPLKENWMTMYESLVEYKEKYNTTNVRQNNTLGHWVGKQRTQLRYAKDGKHSVLSPERKRLLDEIGFEWDGKRGWDYYYDSLKAYIDEHGNTLVPRNYSPDVGLGVWVSEQRMKYRRMRDGHYADGDDEETKRCSDLTPERIKRLNALGFVWKINRTWDDHYENLIAFVKEHGTCRRIRIEFDSHERYGSVRGWLVQQRSAYRRGRLAPDRAAKMEQVEGFEWNPDESRFLAMLARVSAFEEKHGHLRGPDMRRADPKLYNWFTRTKSEYKKFLNGSKSTITPERKAMLDEVGFPTVSRKGAQSVK